MWKKIRARGFLLLELCFNLLLLTLFSAQAFVAGCLCIYGYIPAPAQWLNKTLLEQQFDGFYIQAESFRLKLSGEIELTKLQIYHSEINDPIMTADSTALGYTLLDQGTYQFTPTEFVLSNGTLNMPAIYSPDGNRTTILESVAFHISPPSALIPLQLSSKTFFCAHLLTICHSNPSAILKVRRFIDSTKSSPMLSKKKNISHPSKTRP